MQRKVSVQNSEITLRIFGSFDRNVHRIEEAFGVRIYNMSGDDSGEDSIIIDGSEGETLLAASVIEQLKKVCAENEILTEQTVDYIISMVSDGKVEELAMFGGDLICISAKGRPIKVKTVGQKRYVEAIKKNTVVFGIGPAGTGKTFLAVSMAVKALRAHEVTRIILTRPAVEAGERLGFLPGDLQSKIDPYLRPLYDALYEMLGMENCARLMEKMTIEIAPLAYMRGRTLDDCFIILDEAQNTTPEQMKMFLTRLGNGSKAVVTGDLTQTDLPFGQRSGLSEAVKILRDIDDIYIHEFSDRDVVRHRLVQKIILAYEKNARERASSKEEAKKVQRRVIKQ
ncbi:MAG: PhoH family protein [Ruminococcaceae bacterium]|nr:PhoH family protein [Oscillospiraceae bacterium]